MDAMARLANGHCQSEPPLHDDRALRDCRLNPRGYATHIACPQATLDIDSLTASADVHFPTTLADLVKVYESGAH
jgi:hypothetical protein